MPNCDTFLRDTPMYQDFPKNVYFSNIGGTIATMKKHLSYITILSTILLPQVFGSGPSPPPRALPDGAMVRIGQGQGVDFAFSPDGDKIAIACSIIGIWMHDVHTGKELELLTGHTDAVTSVAYSPDGSILASGSYDKTVRLWDTDTYELRATLTGHAGDTNAIAFSPDGTTLATGAIRSSEIRRAGPFVQEEKVVEVIDSTIRLWDVTSGKPKMTLRGHSGWISVLTYSTDGTVLASASTDGTIRLWDGVTGKDKNTLKGHTGNVALVLFSSNGKRLVSWGNDATARLWDTDTGKQIALINDIHYKAVGFSPDGSTLVCGQGKGNATIRLWDTHTGKQKAELKHLFTDIFSVVFSPDGLKLVTTEDWENKTIRSWELNSSEFQTTLKGDPHPIHSPQRPHPVQVAGRSGWNARLEYSPDGNTLASWSFDEIRLWDAQTGEQKAKMSYPRQREHRYGRPFAAYSSDGKTLVCGNGTTKIWIFDTEPYKFRTTLTGHTAPINSVALSPDGTMFASANASKRIASASKGKTIRLWDIRTGEQHAILNEHADVVHDLAFSPDATMLASSSSDKTVLIWDVQSGELLRRLVGHTDAVSELAFSPDGLTLASGSNEIIVWNTFTGRKKYSLEGSASLAFSPDGKILMTGGEWEIQMWDANSGEHKKTLSGHLDKSWRLTFSPDGKHLVSSGETVQLWDANTGKNLSTLSEKFGIGTLAVSADGTILAGTTGSTIEFWDIPLHQHIATRRGQSESVSSSDISPKDGTIVTASYDGTIVLWHPVQAMDKSTIMKIVPSSNLPNIGDQLTFSIEITGAENVAGYQLSLKFDGTTLQYISSANGDFLPSNAFFMKPVIKDSQLTLAATALTDVGNGDGTLATLTFKVLAANPLSLNIIDLILSDKDGKRIRATVKGMEETK